MINESETWRPMVRYEGIYEVSDLGRIKRIAKARGAVPGRILQPFSRARRYETIILSKDCHPRTYSVHRLVAEAFHGPCPDGYETNHKNGDTLDNRACNLEWVSHIANQRHSVRVLRNNIGEKHPMSKLTEEQVLEVRHLYATTNQSMSDIAAQFSTSRSNVWLIVHRKNWRHI